MKVNSLKRNDSHFPDLLRAISSPPKEIFYVGATPEQWLARPRVAIVGSRKVSSYGREVTYKLAHELARQGIIIISGLCYGVDKEAHLAAIEAGGTTIAILPSSLQYIYPASHTNLARRIVETGGSLISEYPSGSINYKTNFVVRNRIVSGLADIVLITESALKGGSLHTARFALEQGKTVMAVPGNITSENSQGTNNLIKSGAIPVTDVDDVLFALNISPKTKHKRQVFRGSIEEEQALKLIRRGVSAQDELAKRLSLNGAEINTVLTILEINGYIRPAGGGNWLAL